MQLKTILTAIILFFSAAVIFTAAKSAYEKYEALQMSVEAKKGNEIVDELLMSAGNWAVERGVTNSALRSSSQVNAQVRETIDARRQRADQAFEKALTLLESDFDFPEEEKIVQPVKEQYQYVNQLRALVDKDLSLSRQARDTELMKVWVPAMSDLIVKSQKLRYALAVETSRGDITLLTQSSFKHYAWVMSEYAGRERAIIGGTIASQSPIDREQLYLLADFRGKVELAEDTLLKLELMKLHGEELEQAIDVADQKFFGDFEKVRKAIYQAANNVLPGEAASYPIAAQQWIEVATVAINTILAVQEASIKETKGYLDKKISAAEVAMIRDFLITLITILLTGAAVFVVFSKVTGPIQKITSMMEKLAAGELEVATPALQNKDEIGDMARSVEVFKDNAIEKIKLEEKQRQAEARQAAEKRSAMNALADGFEESIGKVLEIVQKSVMEIQSSIQEIQTSSQETSKQSGAILESVEQTASSSQSIATAAEELSSANNEVSSQVNKSSEAARGGVEKSQQAVAKIDELKAAAEEISKVVELINDIAEQTNLLALNATIEAARAGEAGKGFAVVASEVKSLANQTSEATTQIAEQIQQVISSVGESVVAIENVNSTVQEIDSFTTTVSSASEEQNATTSEISQRIQDMAENVQQISVNINGIAKQSNYNSDLTNGLMDMSAELENNFGKLKEESASFLKNIRSEPAEGQPDRKAA